MEENSLPKLRHAGFEDAWQKSLLIEQVEIRRGLTYKPSDVRNNGVRVLRSSNIVEDTFVISDDDVFVDKGAVNIPRISNGDILVTAANGSTKLVGKHAIVKNLADDELAVHGGFMLAIKAEQNDFVNAWMSSKEYKRVLQFVQGGNGAIGNLSTSVLKSMKMTIPASIKEQSAIGSLFRTLDDLLAVYKEKLTNYQDLKSSMLSKMFPKSGQNVPEIRLAEFEGEWEDKQLDEACIVNSGRDYKHLEEGNIPVYGTGGYMLSVNDKLSDEDGIGIGRKGTIDKPYLLKAPYWTVDTLFYVLCREKFDLNFLFLVFQQIHWKKFDESTGVPSLSKKTIEKISSFFPEPDEQHDIGSFFSNLDTLINLYQDMITQLEILKKKLLQDMFI